MSDKKRSTTGNYTRGDWKHFLRFGGLIAAVGGTLLLGAILQSDETQRDGSPPRDYVEFERERPPADTEPRLPSDEVSAGGRAEAPGEAGGLVLEESAGDRESTVDALVRRADDDRARLGDEDGWTLQFMMACDLANVGPRVNAIEGEDDFYLLPTFFDDRACFRLCWGSYPSRADALAARRLPAALLDITDSPQPLPIEQALR